MHSLASLSALSYLILSVNIYSKPITSVAILLNAVGERLNRFSSMIIDKIRSGVNAKQKETTEVKITACFSVLLKPRSLHKCVSLDCRLT